jgi:hypothetical protein
MRAERPLKLRRVVVNQMRFSQVSFRIGCALVVATLVGCSARSQFMPLAALPPVSQPGPEPAPQLAPRCSGPSFPASSISVSPGGAAEAINGLVINLLTLEPMAGVVIELSQQGARLQSDSTGRFRIHGMPHGEYQLVARSAGFRSAQATIPFEGRTNVLIGLSLAAVGDCD